MPGVVSELPEVVVERVETRGLGAQGFGRWLDRWRALRREGWNVTILLANDESHAIGLASRGGAKR